MKVLFILVTAYLLGSIPFGLWVSLWGKGIDPRTSGSGNIGATNVLRTVGKAGGALTLLGDLGKGYLAVLSASLLGGGEPWRFAAGLAAIIGHVFPVFLKFRGGKGVATAFGVLLATSPWVALWLFCLWSAGFGIMGISSVGALLAFGALPILALLFDGTGLFLLFALLTSALIYLKHIPNIQRLIKGTEARIRA